MSELPIIGEVIDSERDTTGTEWLTLRLNKAGRRLLDDETENIMVKVADFRQHGGLLGIDSNGDFRAMPGLPLGVALEEPAASDEGFVNDPGALEYYF